MVLIPYLVFRLWYFVVQVIYSIGDPFQWTIYLTYWFFISSLFQLDFSQYFCFFVKFYFHILNRLFTQVFVYIPYSLAFVPFLSSVMMFVTVPLNSLSWISFMSLSGYKYTNGNFQKFHVDFFVLFLCGILYIWS